MIIRVILTVYIGLNCIFFAPKCHSQSLKIEYDSSRAYIQKGNFAGAIPWLEMAKKSALLNPKDTNGYVEVLKLLAVSYARTNKLPAAEATFTEVENLYAQMPAKQALRVVSLQNFGVFYYNQKKYKEAESVFATAYQIKTALAGEQNIEALTLLNSLASTKLLLKKYAEAEKNYQKLVSSRATLLGESHPDYLSALNSLATVYKLLNKSTEAIEIYTKIAAITKTTKGESSKEYAGVLSNLATCFKNNFQYENAEKNCSTVT